MYFTVKCRIFRRQTGSVDAVDDVSFAIKKGETLGLIEKSGCGKTIVGKTIINFYKALSDEVIFVRKFKRGCKVNKYF